MLTVAIGAGHRTGSTGENIKMLRENSHLFLTRCEPVGLPAGGRCLKRMLAGTAKNRKTAEKTAAFTWCYCRNPCGPRAILQRRTAQVSRDGGGRNAESFERNEPRAENRRANLLYRT